MKPSLFQKLFPDGAYVLSVQRPVMTLHSYRADAAEIPDDLHPLPPGAALNVSAEGKVSINWHLIFATWVQYYGAPLMTMLLAIMYGFIASDAFVPQYNHGVVYKVLFSVGYVAPLMVLALDAAGVLLPVSLLLGMVAMGFYSAGQWVFMLITFVTYIVALVWLHGAPKFAQSFGEVNGQVLFEPGKLSAEQNEHLKQFVKHMIDVPWWALAGPALFVPLVLAGLALMRFLDTLRAAGATTKQVAWFGWSYFATGSYLSASAFLRQNRKLWKYVIAVGIGLWATKKQAEKHESAIGHATDHINVFGGKD